MSSVKNMDKGKKKSNVSSSRKFCTPTNDSSKGADDVDYPYPASISFPETQELNFVDPDLFPQAQTFDFDESEKSQATANTDVNWKEDSDGSHPDDVKKRRQAEPTGWPVPMVPSWVYCLNNRFENGSTAFSSLLFHLDMTLEDYPHSHPINKKHQDLHIELQHQILKMRQLNKQFLRNVKEIKKILDLD